MAAGTAANLSKIRRNNNNLISDIGGAISGGVFNSRLRNILRDLREPEGPQIGTAQQIADSAAGRRGGYGGVTSTNQLPGGYSDMMIGEGGTPMSERTDLRGGYIGPVRTGDITEATGAPGEPTQFSDGSEGYRVNRFGGFAGPTGGGTLKAGMAVGNVPVSTLENFSPEAQTAARGMFGTQSQRQMGFVKPRQLITF